jgi:hypothetical protein
LTVYSKNLLIPNLKAKQNNQNQNAVEKKKLDESYFHKIVLNFPPTTKP